MNIHQKTFNLLYNCITAQQPALDEVLSSTDTELVFYNANSLLIQISKDYADHKVESPKVIAEMYHSAATRQLMILTLLTTVIEPTVYKIYKDEVERINNSVGRMFPIELSFLKTLPREAIPGAERNH